MIASLVTLQANTPSATSTYREPVIPVLEQQPSGANSIDARVSAVADGERISAILEEIGSASTCIMRRERSDATS